MQEEKNIKLSSDKEFLRISTTLFVYVTFGNILAGTLTDKSCIRRFIIKSLTIVETFEILQIVLINGYFFHNFGALVDLIIKDSSFCFSSQFFNINSMSDQDFQILKELHTSFDESQCVLHKHELVTCGGKNERACYSYHTLKNEYKFICKYPSNQSNHIAVFCGNNYKHTSVMKYISVWSNISDISNKSNELNNYNEWIPLTDNHNCPIIIGRDQDNYVGARAVIDGRDNLLFITYYENNSVFDLNKFQFIEHTTLPTNDYTWYHCIVSNSENGQEQEMMTKQKKMKQNCQMLLFKQKTGLLIEYDEYINFFQFHKIHVCDNIAPFDSYAYVCVNDIILFFGGYCYKNVDDISNTLPSPLCYCVAILNEENNCIHIIGGQNDKKTKVSTHMKTNVRVWDPSQLVYLFILIKQN
ncbi:hypothetical protein RFI_39946 [Reticulomyxa filosa]|uniref:Kelch motif family protein n=1 Tax=Reticulomyxa filosa TaxID=46433 RepID=X6L8Z1_RETFI|nr:hypothetical protein RFI_39946 [Reticulomyxa filosa]|eukprot:ETN97581.1 hypothetical protein RFI_39946 [Reticulomyxa filosa]